MSLRQLSRSFLPLTLPIRTMTQLSGRHFKNEEATRLHIERITKDLKHTTYSMVGGTIFSSLTVFFLLVTRKI